MSEVKNKKSLTKQDLFKSYMLWISMTQATYSYERLQAPGFVSAMMPAIERLYGDDPEAKKEMCRRHMEFFNTEPWLTGPGVVGITLSMEEERANGVPITGEDISGVKTSLMGPMAGIGDTLRQGTLIPIIGSIAITLGLSGNFIGPIFYMVATLGINYALSYMLFKFAYNKGKEGIQDIFASGQLEKFMTLATTVGAIAIGGLAATTVNVSSKLVITLGKNTLSIQALLDKILKGILPLGAIYLAYYLLQKKKLSSTKVLLVLIAISIVGVLIHFN